MIKLIKLNFKKIQKNYLKKKSSRHVIWHRERRKCEMIHFTLCSCENTAGSCGTNRPTSTGANEPNNR